MKNKIYLDYRIIEETSLNAWEVADRLAKALSKANDDDSYGIDFDALKQKIFLEIIHQWGIFTLVNIDDQKILKQMKR